MYAPRHFRQADFDRLLDLIDQHPFVTLSMAGAAGVQTAHLPVLIDRAAGVVRGHLAKANPLVALIDGQTPALLVAQGPNAYVSPDWYQAEHQVPTWNYLAVHVRGTPTRLDDAATIAVLDALSEKFEAPLAPKPIWQSSKLPPELFQGLRKAIVGFELPISAIEGNWKLSQNKNVADRAGVITALQALDGPNNQAIAKLMQDSLAE